MLQSHHLRRSSSPSSEKKTGAKPLLQPSTTATSTNFEAWLKLKSIEIEAIPTLQLARSAYPTLSSRLRESSTQASGSGESVERYSDDNLQAATRTQAQEEKMSQAQKGVLIKVRECPFELDTLFPLALVCA